MYALHSRICAHKCYVPLHPNIVINHSTARVGRASTPDVRYRMKIPLLFQENTKNNSIVSMFCRYQSTTQAQESVETAKAEIPDENRMFAVVQVSGLQFKVTTGDVIMVNTLEADVGSEIVLQKVLLVGSKHWTAIGTPMVLEAKVHAVVEEQTRSAKLMVFKKKRRKNYRRHNSHKQPITTLRIGAIEFDYNNFLKSKEIQKE